MEIKLLKCAVFHDRRSGNNWYKDRKNYLLEVIVLSNILPFCKSDDYHKYLGKSLSLCGENKKQIEEFMNKYKILVD